MVSRYMKRQPQHQGDLALLQPTFRIVNRDTGRYSELHATRRDKVIIVVTYLQTLQPPRVTCEQDRLVQ